MGRVGSLVDSMPFVRRVVGSKPALPPHKYFEQVLHLQLLVALRRETRTQYPCCVRSASEW